jgi:starch synthase
LQQRGEVLHGIINGVDYTVWNPAHDTLIPKKYSANNWQSGKAVCKAALQTAMNLPAAPSTPVIGLIGRLADQKGWDLVASVMKRWLREVDVQWVILGTGELEYHELISSLAKEFPNRIGAKLEFSEKLAHLIESGSDIFLMPSRYEPCGLNQLYSLKYGSVPVVRETGGLADTVCDVTAETLASNRATGFSFNQYDISALEETLRRAIGVYTQEPKVWSRIVENGMRQDWSWDNSAKRYLDVYAHMISVREQACAKVEGLR